MGTMLYGVCRKDRVLKAVAKIGGPLWTGVDDVREFLYEHLDCKVDDAGGDYLKPFAVADAPGEITRQAPALCLVPEWDVETLEENGYRNADRDG